MRLERIKLAGFKSFVDPTTVHFPSNLVGIVGPNGCGKSNVIDAVRWVMGESSAKMLRGESMADVIFNGSSSRKPVGTAGIELVFDNADGSAGGQYAQYAQISVKRQVSRDGQSQYYLNGVKCRRRDITDLFLGTGLGPRSYSIIEQGMISRIIESRPEDMRVYLEEAAGISKYKERRRETENRIGHTRENLERLDDLREEVQKQLRHLERQAATAERYKVLKQEERRARAELLALRLQTMRADMEERDRAIAAQENRLQEAVAGQRGVEAEIEEKRSAHAAANDEFNAVQGRFYAVGSDIARLEEAIQYAREARRRQETDLQEAEKALHEARGLSSADQEKLTSIADGLERDRPLLEEARMRSEEARDVREAADAAMRAWQQGWDDFNQKANEPAQEAQVERTRINHLEQQEAQLRRRLERNAAEQENLSDAGLRAEIVELGERRAVAADEVETARAAIQDSVRTIEEVRDGLRDRQQRLADQRSELETTRGRMASLQALQQAALGQDDSERDAWVAANGLAAARRVVEALDVEPGWQTAVEVVLGEHLQGLLVERLDSLGAAFDSAGDFGIQVFEQVIATGRPGTLGGVSRGPAGLLDMLDGVRLADDRATALAGRGDLAPGEMLVTPDGSLMGRGWVSLPGQGHDGSRGMLAREQEIRALSERLAVLEPGVAELQERLEQDQAALAEAERQREERQRSQDDATRSLGEINALLSGKQARAEQIRHRLEGLEKDAAEIRQQVGEGAVAMEDARERLHAALADIEQFGRQREDLVAQRERHSRELEQAHANASALEQEVHGLALRVESMRSSEDSLRSGLDRIQGQLQQLEERCELLRSDLANGREPIGAQQEELERRLADRVQVETELADTRKKLEAIDHRLRELEQGRHAAEQQVQTRREKLDRTRMGRQEVAVRSRTLEEQLGETGFDAAQLLEDMPQGADIPAWQDSVDKLAGRIQRLGPINLAAIEEFREQGERMEYLDRQHADVTKSLETLEDAIRKIDRETRTRFKETFDRVDAGFKDLFPKLFGGGHAYLELTGEDLLDTGVAVMARPPGKRNSSIHLLSGGEKALTAVALVFAIFRLNPAPFCMLDEVDAPLDDANVSRYSALVREMSEHVQFIFITHNKVTMEIANQLSGVTMHEPGVSRLVTVDVEEAAALAAV